MNVKFPNNTSKWQMEFNSAFKGLIFKFDGTHRPSFQWDLKGQTVKNYTLHQVLKLLNQEGSDGWTYSMHE
jgi:hypothetical protein